MNENGRKRTRIILGSGYHQWTLYEENEIVRRKQEDQQSKRGSSSYGLKIRYCEEPQSHWVRIKYIQEPFIFSRDNRHRLCTTAAIQHHIRALLSS